MSSMEMGVAIVDALVGVGVRHVVLAPGSRSAALALAVDRAAAEGSIDLQVRVDERVAGFTALGMAKAGQRPVAVVTTSGTAVANLAPAAMEASASGVPLVLITADRPAHLVGTGANQVAEQVGAFGPSALGVIRLSSESGGAAAWTAGVHRAVTQASGRLTGEPGPVHLNVEFAAPLVGPLPASRPRPFDVHADSRPTQPHIIEHRARTVILVGDATPRVGAEARALAELTRSPLLAEPSSNARAGECAIAAYRDVLAELGPEIERVIVYGHPTLSRPVVGLLSRADVELVVVTDRATWPDPGHRAALVARGVQIPAQDESWLGRWRRADVRRGDGPQQFIADEVLKDVGPGCNLVLGSSSIIRAADLSPVAERPPTVYANRGVAGIDGTVSTAVGIGLATGRPTTVLMGDLTAQHDLGGLVRPTLERWPDLRVVVADDDGGSIFHGLEQGAPAFAGSFERVFGTPQGVDLVAVAAALGWTAVRVRDRRGLVEALSGDADFIAVSVSRG